jgi:7-cyano-7-deazaguanine synthase in queuosine biosynthesis
MQPTSKSIWERDESRAPCPGKHTWVYYHSYKFRECLDCERREALWADFGLVREAQE